MRVRGFWQVIDGLALVEAGHFNRKLDRRAVAVDIERSIAVLRDRNDSTIDLRRELAVDVDLFVAGGFALLKRRIIQERETDGALDLQRAVAFEKDRRRMGVDPVDPRMHRGVGQKRKDALLHARSRWR